MFDPYYTWLGIPPQEQPPNHCRLLGIAVLEEKVEAIENAADQRMAHLRTLQTGSHGAMAQKLLNEVAAARRMLAKRPQDRPQTMNDVISALRPG